MATEEQIDAACRRLDSSRREIFQLAHVLKGDRPLHPASEGFPRSHIMRALTGQQGRSVLGSAALALAMSRPRAAWRLAGLVPLVRPLIVRFLADRLLRPKQGGLRRHKLNPEVDHVGKYE
jgi:hypothetical protein